MAALLTAIPSSQQCVLYNQTRRVSLKKRPAGKPATMKIDQLNFIYSGISESVQMARDCLQRACIWFEMRKIGLCQPRFWT
jgi:hypothetical protein